MTSLALDVAPFSYRGPMVEGLPSLDLVASRVEVQLDHQLRHFDGLDNKAGIVLGFAGVLVAIADGFEALAIAGRIGAVGAALLALWAFLPRKYPVLDTRKLRDRYLRADSGFTKLHLLDTQIRMEEGALHFLTARLSASDLPSACSPSQFSSLPRVCFLLEVACDRRTETRISSPDRRKRGTGATAALRTRRRPHHLSGKRPRARGREALGQPARRATRSHCPVMPVRAPSVSR